MDITVSDAIKEIDMSFLLVVLFFNYTDNKNIGMLSVLIF